MLRFHAYVCHYDIRIVRSLGHFLRHLKDYKFDKYMVRCNRLYIVKENMSLGTLGEIMVVKSVFVCLFIKQTLLELSQVYF